MIYKIQPSIFYSLLALDLIDSRVEKQIYDDQTYLIDVVVVSLYHSPLYPWLYVLQVD
jgi:hypothetical protein